MNTKSYTIRTAAATLKVSEMYLRKMIRQGKISTSKVQVTDNVWRHEISEAELNRFSSRSKVRSSREDGRNKFNAYMNRAEEAKVRKVLTEAGLAEVAKLITRANTSKS